MRYATGIIFLIVWMLLVAFSWAQTTGPNPMGAYSNNPTLDELWAQMNHLSLIKPHLQGQTLLDEAIKRAYILKNGEEI